VWPDLQSVFVSHSSNRGRHDLVARQKNPTEILHVYKLQADAGVGRELCGSVGRKKCFEFQINSGTGEEIFQLQLKLACLSSVSTRRG
jgi:hypothetical protein